VSNVASGALRGEEWATVTDMETDRKPSIASPIGKPSEVRDIQPSEANPSA